MHCRPLVFLLVYALTGPAVFSQSVQRTVLSLQWQFAEHDSSTWYDAAVPGCIHTDLLRHGLIEDPFLSDNEQRCQWVGERNWSYRSLPFDVDEVMRAQQHVELVFHGLDTYAEVYLNEVLLLSADNAFRTWTADAKNTLRATGNVLRIEFSSAVQVGEEQTKNLRTPVPGDALRAVTRKPQYQYGWDWGPKLITCGITAPVELVGYSTAIMCDLYIRQDRVSEERAACTAVFTIESLVETTVDLQLRYQPLDGTYLPEPMRTEIRLRVGTNTIELPIELQHPSLWWCNDWGKQPLYGFYAHIALHDAIIDEASVRTGLRSLQLVSEKDREGQSFYFSLNGKAIFAKGANVIPLAYFPATATRDDYVHLLERCRESHFNMLRVWGGGIYQNDVFYDLCDEYGILVWQDFMFACSMVPGGEAFLQNVIAEAEEHTVRLRNHPCMALWCGNNEASEGWHRWGWQDGLSAKQVKDVWKNYGEIFREALPAIVQKNTTTSYWESSPMLGRGDAKHVNYGDAHYWGVWHDDEPFAMYQQKVPRFMSEFGFQSFPSDAVVMEMMKDHLWFDDVGILNHQKHPRGFKLIQGYLRRDDPGPSPLDFLVYAEQSRQLQKKGVGIGILAHRAGMPHCMGTLFWQLNDVWPAFSWSAIDYKMNEKPLFAALKEWYDPVMIFSEWKKDTLFISAISDGPEREKISSFRVSVKYADQHPGFVEGGMMEIPEGKKEISELVVPPSKQQDAVVLVELLNERGCLVRYKLIPMRGMEDVASLAEPVVMMDADTGCESVELRFLKK